MVLMCFFGTGIEKNQEQGITYCDILFDSSFTSGVQYHTKKKRVYKLPDKCLLNITYAKKKYEKEELKKSKYPTSDCLEKTRINELFYAFSQYQKSNKYIKTQLRRISSSLRH